MLVPTLISITILVIGKRSETDTPLMECLRKAGHRIVHCDHAKHVAQAIEAHAPNFIIIGVGAELWQAIEYVWALRIEELDELPFVIIHADENPSLSDLTYLNDAALPLSGYGLFTSDQREQVLRVVQQLTQKLEPPVLVPVDPKQTIPSQPTRTPKQRTMQQPWWATYSPSLNAIRASMVLAIVFLVALSAISAMISPTGMVIFEKILPILALSAGYLFGRQG